jgi:hypothetical protein
MRASIGRLRHNGRCQNRREIMLKSAMPLFALVCLGCNQNALPGAPLSDAAAASPSGGDLGLTSCIALVSDPSVAYDYNKYEGPTLTLPPLAVAATPVELCVHLDYGAGAPELVDYQPFFYVRSQLEPRPVPSFDLAVLALDGATIGDSDHAGGAVSSFAETGWVLPDRAPRDVLVRVTANDGPQTAILSLGLVIPNPK